MKQDQTNIQELWELFISDKASIQQVNTLFECIKNAANDDENIAFFREAINKVPPSFYKTDDEVVHSILGSIIASDKDLKASLDTNTGVAPVRSIRTLRNKWGWAAAVSIVLLLGVGSYFRLTKKEKRPTIVVNTGTNIAAPASNRAMVTLSDGTKLFLDSVGNGQLAQQGTIKLVKLANGKIAYQSQGDGNASPAGRDQAVAYNTLSNPRGSTVINMRLSDGTQVWLNVGSSLTYPTVFTGKERRVTITGEAYFEVADNAAMPFRVQHGDVTISVLGTHFNVNTYEDETAQRITLLKGSVQINKKNVSKLLEPGQQASISHDETNDIKVSGEVNVDEVMAWREGRFQFGESMDIGTIMRQISRWYDAEIEYKGVVSQRFVGSISKDVNVSQVLQILEATGGVKFNIEGNKIVVIPGAEPE